MNPEEIEHIVHEVTRRLAAEAGSAMETLVVSDRLVTLATLAGRLRGVRRVMVPEQAVVTPSVRDELKRQQIELSRHANHHTDTAGTKKRLLLMGTLNSTIAPFPVDLPCDVRKVNANSLEEIISIMRSRLDNSNSLGAIFTDVPEQAVCLANRHVSLRAFQGTTESNLRRALDTLAGNLLVLEAGITSSAAQRMLDAFIGRAPLAKEN